MSQKILFCASVFREDVNSAGRHMIDLVKEFDRRGLSCEVVTNIGHPMPDLPNTEVRSLGLGLRGKAKPLRLLYEIITPFALYVKYIASRRCVYAASVSFSPSIFWYLYLKFMGRRIRGKKILILRDIFPLWLAEVGMLRRNQLAYLALDYFCRKQLQSYDIILVQNEGDMKILRQNYKIDCELAVLQNWYSPSPKMLVRNNIIDFCKNDAFTLAVVGNFGAAQDLDHSCKLLVILMQKFPDIRILFIGQGDEAQSHFEKHFSGYSGRVQLEGRMSHDEVINTLAYVDAGYFSLEESNSQGHFPGKVLAYLMAGRPIFGLTGVDAPIAEMLMRDGLGVVTHSKDEENIVDDFASFKAQNWSNDDIKKIAYNRYNSDLAFNIVKEKIRDE